MGYITGFKYIPVGGNLLCFIVPHDDTYNAVGFATNVSSNGVFPCQSSFGFITLPAIGATTLLTSFDNNGNEWRLALTCTNATRLDLRWEIENVGASGTATSIKNSGEIVPGAVLPVYMLHHDGTNDYTICVGNSSGWVSGTAGSFYSVNGKTTLPQIGTGDIHYPAGTPIETFIEDVMGTYASRWYAYIDFTNAGCRYAVVKRSTNNETFWMGGFIGVGGGEDIGIYINQNITPGPTHPDPYDQIPQGGQGGGNRPYNPYDTDDIDYNLLPEVSAVGTGFISLWCPTEQQMLNLSSYMWNADVFTLDWWRKLIADPLQLVYGLNIIPLDLREAGIVGDDPDTVVVGPISTGVKMDYLTSQWVELDCGELDIDESMLGSYLDYDPYTKIDIYLPYIGYRPLRVDDFMPGTISLKYKIDLLTGSCVAQIKSTKLDYHGDELNSIIYQFMGNCATQIPVTATQYADAVRSAITTAAAIGTVALLAGSGGAAAAGAGATLMPTGENAGLLSSPGMVPVDSDLYNSMFRYNMMTIQDSGTSEVASASNTLKNVGAIHSGASAVENVMGLKPSVERSGAIGGAAGMLATQIPYLIFTRPNVAHPENQSTYTGYPSFMTKKFSELVGFTKIQEVHLEGLPCTASELAEIDALLRSGVIF